MDGVGNLACRDLDGMSNLPLRDVDGVGGVAATIYVKSLRTPSINDYKLLLSANFKNYKRFQIYSKRSFICHQAEISSSSRLEMASILS